MQDVLQVRGAITAEENEKTEALLDRIVAMLTKLGQRGYSAAGYPPCARKKTGLLREEQKMSDLQRYIKKRKARDPEFARDFDSGYERFKVGVMLKQAREEAGIAQEELARKLGTKKSAVSRIENHAEDIKLSTLEKFARALGKHLRVEVA